MSHRRCSNGCKIGPAGEGHERRCACLQCAGGAGAMSVMWQNDDAGFQRSIARGEALRRPGGHGGLPVASKCSYLIKNDFYGTRRRREGASYRSIIQANPDILNRFPADCAGTIRGGGRMVPRKVAHSIMKNSLAARGDACGVGGSTASIDGR